MDRNAFIKEQILAGKDREAVRRELISQGESTADLENTYNALVQELGVQPPQAPAPKILEYTQSAYAQSVLAVAFPSLREALTYGFAHTLRHVKEVLVASVLLFVPVLLFALLPSTFPPILIGSGIFSLFVTCVGIAVLAYAVVASSEASTPLHALQWGVNRSFSFFWLGSVIVLVLSGSIAAFVIPFFLVSLYIVFAIPVLVKEDTNGVRALLRSHDLVKGHFFRIGGYILVVSLIGLVAGGVSTILYLIPIPFLGHFAALFVSLFFSGVYLSVVSLLYAARAQEKPLFDLSDYGGTKWMYRLFALIGLICMGISLWSVLGSANPMLNEMLSREVGWELIGNEEEGADVNISDGVVQSKVVTTAASAKLYVGRMGFYDGVCDDISVVAPVQCKNTSEYFMVYAPLSASSFYCTDSHGFSGEVARPKESACQ